MWQLYHHTKRHFARFLPPLLKHILKHKVYQHCLIISERLENVNNECAYGSLQCVRNRSNIVLCAKKHSSVYGNL